jgi:hypothetical protein
MAVVRQRYPGSQPGDAPSFPQVILSKLRKHAIANPHREPRWKAGSQMKFDLTPVKAFDVLEYLQTGIAHFKDSPAGCDFERGYEQALRDMRQEFFGVASDEQLH